ncbi:TPA: hypothetical protein ACGOXY_002014 [Streptococcus suis]
MLETRLNEVKTQRQIEHLKRENRAKDKRIESLKRTNNELASDGLKHGSSKAGSYMANKRYGK